MVSIRYIRYSIIMYGGFFTRINNFSNILVYLNY